MGLNDTVNADRMQIGFFGRTNAGKSSIVNAITGQALSIVSDVAGTTTDPVQKAMELLPIGPILIIDTPGYDDDGILGLERVKRSKQIINRIDAAVLVIDASIGKTDTETGIISEFDDRKIPYIIVYNKSDLLDREINKSEHKLAENEIYVCAMDKTGVNELKELMGSMFMKPAAGILISDIVNVHDYVILVVPIDSAAPKGRLILPEQKVIRDVLDSRAKAIVIQEDELKSTLKQIGVKPSLVITDSQAFEKVSAETPDNILLTSFSILMARYNGFLDIAVRGAEVIGKLKDGDTILISEGCTHHRQCGDIGTVKLPAWINKYTGCSLNYEYSSGGTFPEQLDKYRLIVHCGGCMLNEKQMHYRMRCAEAQNTSVTNYGIAIAYMNGILERAAGWIPKIK